MSTEQTYKLVITGFKSKKQIEAFLAWYSNAGEQDFGDALEFDDEADGMTFLSFGLENELDDGIQVDAEVQT